jgi:hypothetical protein
MRVVTPMRRVAAILAAAALTLAACGGSGSSGFDAAPASETEAIARARDAGVCLDFEGTTFCGPGAEAALGGGAAARLVIEADTGDLVCAARPGDGGCEVSLAFVPEGFPPETVFLAALAADESGPWRLAETRPPAIGAPGDGAAGDVLISLPEPGGTEPLQVAVLVYLRPPPTDLPVEGGRLGRFGADLVYLSPRLTVEAAP